MKLLAVLALVAVVALAYGVNLNGVLIFFRRCMNFVFWLVVLCCTFVFLLLFVLGCIHYIDGMRAMRLNDYRYLLP